jgi:hypothetical protein
MESFRPAQVSRLEHAIENGAPLSSFLIAEYVIDGLKRDRSSPLPCAQGERVRVTVVRDCLSSCSSDAPRISLMSKSSE